MASELLSYAILTYENHQQMKIDHRAQKIVGACSGSHNGNLLLF